MNTLKIFCSYALKDKKLMERFSAHLQVLKPQQVSIWYKDDIPPGVEWERERDSQLYSADIVLFLVSSDFISSSEHYEKEVLPAMERHSRSENRVIPIILRPVHWQGTALGRLLPLPEGGRPITDSSWTTRDHAFFNVVSGIKRVINDEKNRLPTQQKNWDTTPHSAIESAHTSYDASTRLEQIIQDFKLLRIQIANFVFMKGPKGFSLEGCENQYNNLYGDTMVFLATYLPESVSDGPEGFVETVHRKATEQLRKRGDIYVSVARFFIPYLSELEKVAEQIDACIATLEFYKQKYSIFSSSDRFTGNAKNL